MGGESECERGLSLRVREREREFKSLRLEKFARGEK